MAVGSTRARPAAPRPWNLTYHAPHGQHPDTDPDRPDDDPELEPRPQILFVTKADQALVLLTGIVALASLITAGAALWNARASKVTADIARREFHLARRPSIEVAWDDPFTPDGVLVELTGAIRDAADIPTTLHRATLTLLPSHGGRERSWEVVSTPVDLRGDTLTQRLDVPFTLEPGDSMNLVVSLCVSTVGDYWEHWTHHALVHCSDDGPHLAHTNTHMERVTPARPRHAEHGDCITQALTKAWRGFRA